MENFYYFIWGERRWLLLVFSIISLRKIYQYNAINVVCYTNPPDYIIDLQDKINFKIIFIQDHFIKIEKFFDDSNPVFQINKKLIYKVLDFLQIISKENQKAILLDCDILFISKFENINWQKVSLYCDKSYTLSSSLAGISYVNTGVVALDSSSVSFIDYKKNFEQQVLNMTQEGFDQKKYIILSMGQKWLDWRLTTLELSTSEVNSERLLIQEEIINNFMFKKNPVLFHNIGINNNGFVFKKEVNNLHLINYSPEDICNIAININYFKKNIIKLIPNSLSNKSYFVEKSILEIIKSKKIKIN
jgi:hypothetical protein